ncbi:sacsin N-terminal ATP-binding-like domain-containing protein [Actinophytocola sediminis]
MNDPFNTARLRDAVLAAWRTSPTRLREDANSEEDLYLGGYRDRLLTELAQNAADAAEAAGTTGHLRVSIVDNELRVANTGQPLDAAGVASLASLRASAKQHGVGQFGLGFAAVLTVCDEPRVISRTGGVAFSASRTREAIDTTDRVPVLRLVWPTDEDDLPAGFDTEVRLPLRETPRLDEFAAQAVDLLLSLDTLTRIDIGDRTWHRTGDDIHGPDGVTHWTIVRKSGELPAELTAGLPSEHRPQWTICWAYTEHQQEQVLHAPTPTDERLSLPARLIATLPVEPSRRRLMPGKATDIVLDEAVRLYPRLLDAADNPTELVPLPGFPLSEVDDRLRQGIIGALRTTPWLPTPDADGDPVAPSKAALLPTNSQALAELLTDVIPNLVAADLAAPEHAAALAALDTNRLHTADIVAAVTGIDRAPTWWHQLYDALSPIAEVDADAREALGGLPVPLADGRTIPGPRGTLIVEDTDLAIGDAVHPDAAHPLLERLGARRGGAADLLDSLRDAVERSVEDAESGMDIDDLRHTVLTLATSAGVRPGEYPWLAAIALPDEAGDWRRADELALPDAPLLDLLDEDTPLGVLHPDTAQAWPKHVLTAVGVLDTFALTVDDAPTAPDHDLADEHDWWDSRPEPPHRMTAVRDLDLVAEHAWPAALRLLAADPDTWRALHEPGGYTGWWIANHARLDGQPPRALRMPDATDLTGLYDPAPPVDLDPSVLRAIGVREHLELTGADDAEDLLARLADQERQIPTGTAMRAHAALATAVQDGEVDADDVQPPIAVRTLTGEILPAAEAMVLNAPWVLGVASAERVITAGLDFQLAEPLADVLDVPLATEVVIGEVRAHAEPVRWADLGAVVDACDLAGIAVPPGGPLVHDRLTVRIGLADHEVSWWVDRDIVHCTDSTAGMARALAWATGRWDERHTFAALLEDPESLLG